MIFSYLIGVCMPLSIPNHLYHSIKMKLSKCIVCVWKKSISK